jgi:23S rRNA (guanosine2251-2'-O)-methyltransferase
MSAPRRLHHEEIAATLPGGRDAIVRMPVVLVVDNVRSLYNVGSIFRSCDGVAVEKLWLCGYTPHPPRREIDKTALGATESVPWQHVHDVREALVRVRDDGFRIAALEQTDAGRSLFTVAPEDFPLALVIGNEIDGVSDEALALCDMAFELPMRGAKHSLNVAVAAGVALYESLRVWQTISVAFQNSTR